MWPVPTLPGKAHPIVIPAAAVGDALAVLVPAAPKVWAQCDDVDHVGLSLSQVPGTFYPLHPLLLGSAVGQLSRSQLICPIRETRVKREEASCVWSWRPSWVGISPLASFFIHKLTRFSVLLLSHFFAFPFHPWGEPLLQRLIFSRIKQIKAWARGGHRSLFGSTAEVTRVLLKAY